MVALPDVIASNQRIPSTLPSGLVAVFVGGTSGVGEYTLKAFSRYAPSPRVYVIGRSQEAADRILKECRESNPKGTFEFFKTDVSLLKNVDEVCRKIKTKETTINILFQSQGSMAFDTITSEGLPQGFALGVHSRTRFMLNLLPLVQRASSLRRIVSVLAASLEGAIDTDNIYCRGFGMFPQRDQTASIQTLLLQELARRAPGVSFVHDVPGLVKGGITRDAKGFKNNLFVLIGKAFQPFFQTPPAECGERQLFLATSARYPPGQGEALAGGVPVNEKLEVAGGSDGRSGSGVYTVNVQCDSSPAKVVELLAQFHKDGTAEKVWDHIMADFKKITGSEVAA
ncbi:hypothetical protein G7046_g7788 [Stylonectria norvegica]|nr:hypothetical protein G7046_g7788 [Stylonectria norvegica]